MSGAGIANKAMEGGGFYNRNSDLQSAGIALALPLLEEVARTVPLDLAEGQPIVIADYGASQGRNSMAPMAIAIDTLRARAGSDRPVELIHTDLPSNDFASLFTALVEDPASYLAGRTGLFPSAVGRSYFEPILPPGLVHLGWNSWTLHWLSHNPVEVDDHVLAILSASSEARAAVRRQSAEDWTAFLAARATELAPGARMLCLILGATPERHGWEWITGLLWQALCAMADEGLLTLRELARFSPPVVGRTQADIEAPFAQGPFHGLSPDHVEVRHGPDPFWDDYQATGDAAQFGRKWAGTMRAVCRPIAAAAFADRPNADALVDDLFGRLQTLAAADPRRLNHFMATVVLRKAAS